MDYFKKLKELSDQEKYNEAVKIGRQWCQAEPTNAKAWYNLGTVLYCKQENAKAINALSTCLELDESHVYAHSNLGSIYCCMKKFQTAVPHFKKAVHFSDNNKRGEVMPKLIDCYINLEQYQLATPLISQLYEIDENMALLLEGKLVRGVIPGRQYSWWQKLFDKFF